MTGVEIFLLLAGCVFMVGSFFITEKLSPSELNKIAELSEEELRRIVDREINGAGPRIEDAIDNQIDASSDTLQRALQRETNKEIMAINEYSETVIQDMNKTHNEIMFLYSMLNDKHTELTSMVSDLQRLAADVRNLQETLAAPSRQESVPLTENVQKTPSDTGMEEAVSEIELSMMEDLTEETDTLERDNHNREILLLHKEGMNEVEIARKLGLGIGEVKLVIGLYRGEIDL